MIGEQQLAEFEEQFGSPGRALSRLIRPTIAAPKDRTLVWGDWSAIEARVLPWLADTRGAHKVLDIFRASDADPTVPDIYMVEAGNVLGMDPGEMWEKYRAKDGEAKQWRQQGKVPVLSLGFGGGVGALQAMATNYGVSLTTAEAQIVVDKWRENNRWARAFWNALWEAFLAAMKNPGVPYEVGRVIYQYDEDYMNGAMLCFLPDGRPLCYPHLKWKEREREDREGNVTKKLELTYRRGYNTHSLWYGVLAENITQACAGSLLREVMAELAPAPTIEEALWINGPRPKNVSVPALSPPAELIGHTHDEVIAECDDNDDAIELAQKEIETCMVQDRDWTEGLPLAAEVSVNWYYTKTVD